MEYHEIDEMRELHLREMKAQEHTIVLLQILREVLSERVLIEKRILENGDLSLECPANFEPVCMRETGAKGAGDGTRKEAYA